MKDDGSVTTQPGSGPRLLLGYNEKEPGKFLFEFNGDSVSWTNQIPVALVLTKWNHQQNSYKTESVSVSLCLGGLE